MKKYQSFLPENFRFLEVKFSIYLNRRVFVMQWYKTRLMNIKKTKKKKKKKKKNLLVLPESILQIKSKVMEMLYILLWLYGGGDTLQNMETKHIRIVGCDQNQAALVISYQTYLFNTLIQGECGGPMSWEHVLTHYTQHRKYKLTTESLLSAWTISSVKITIGNKEPNP